MRNVVERIRNMLFGHKPAQVVTPATHAADMAESSRRRHELIGRQAELERRLYFLSLEARADAGWHGPHEPHPRHGG